MEEFDNHEPIAAFLANDLLDCTACGRKSPPTRLNCFYCGTPLNSDVIRDCSSLPNFKKIESWELGFNVVTSGQGPNFKENSVRDISRFLNIDFERLRKAITSDSQIPIKRLESLAEAEAAIGRLNNFGLEVIVVSDADLNPNQPPKRLRSISFKQDVFTLTLFNTGEIVKIPGIEMALIVSGSIFEKRIDTTQKYVKSKENRTLNVDEMTNDERIIDLYSNTDKIGFRALTHGFDFSSLKEQMSFTAHENIKKLREMIANAAPGARVMGNYDDVRNFLAEVWFNEEIVESQGVTSKGMGRITLNKTKSITNLGQFTKFSRLKRHLI